MNVLLVKHFVEDMHVLMPEVAQHLNALGIRTRVVHDRPPSWKHRLWAYGQPAVVISLRPLEHFKPAWTTVWQQQWLSKIEEYEALERHGLPVAKWRAVYPDQKPDLSDFSDYVVVKPAQSAWGAMVRVMRKDKVRWQPLEIKRLGKVSHALIAQEYIHTGARPTHYRVATLFGEPIYCWRTQANAEKPPIEFDGNANENFAIGKTIVSSGKGCTYHDDVPQAVVNLACKAHDAFPDIPLLGVDILRESDTGALYVSEVNASGGTFHLRRDREPDFYIEVAEQFGGTQAVARGIAKRMRHAAMQALHVRSAKAFAA